MNEIEKEKFQKYKKIIDKFLNTQTQNIETSTRNLEERYEKKMRSTYSEEERKKYHEEYERQLTSINKRRNALSRESFAYYNFITEVDSLSDNAAMNKVYTAVNGVKEELKDSTPEVEKQSQNMATELNDAYKKDIKLIQKEKQERLEKSYRELLSALSNGGHLKNTVYIDGHESPSIETVINSIKSLSTHPSKQLDESAKINPRPTIDTEKKLKTIEVYNEKTLHGEMDRVQKEDKITFFTKVGFTPRKAIISGKDALLKMASFERQLDAIDKALTVIGNDMQYTNTIKEFKSLQEKIRASLKKATNEFEKSDFGLIDEAVKMQKEKEELESAMNSYASLYAELEELNNKYPLDQKRINEILSELNSLANRAHMTENDIWLAQNKGRDIYHSKLEDKRFEEKEKQDAKIANERMTIARSELEAKIREEKRQEMVREGWHPSDQQIWNGHDVDNVEYQKLWNEELERRVKSALFPTQSVIKEDTFAQSKEMDSMHDAIDYMLEIENMSENRRYTDEELQKEKAKRTDYYMSTIELSKEQRALNTLKKDGYIRADATLDTLSPLEKSALEAQIRTEAQISSSLEEFKKAKEQYDVIVKQQGDVKIAKYTDGLDLSSPKNGR